jgi:hypothetical protein
MDFTSPTNVKVGGAEGEYIASARICAEAMAGPEK